MFRIESKVNPSGTEFRQNLEAYRKLLDTYRERLALVRQGGSDVAVKRHKERGKLLARERIDLLVDRNTPFIELSPMAAFDLYNNEFPSAGIVTGIGVIHGKEVMIVANDATVKGGTYVKETIKKHVRAQEIAMENQLPCVYLVDSGGVFLPEQANVFPDKYDFGRFLLQPGKAVGSGDPAGGGGHGILHRRRGLCARHERRDHHRQEPGDDLYRRSAAGEGRNR